MNGGLTNLYEWQRHRRLEPRGDRLRRRLLPVVLGRHDGHAGSCAGG